MPGPQLGACNFTGLGGSQAAVCKKCGFWQPEAAQDRDPGNGCGNERGPEAGVQEAEKGSEDVGRAYPESF